MKAWEAKKKKENEEKKKQIEAAKICTNELNVKNAPKAAEMSQNMQAANSDKIINVDGIDGEKISTTTVNKKL